jgi:hypothetical protein
LAAGIKRILQCDGKAGSYSGPAKEIEPLATLGFAHHHTHCPYLLLDLLVRDAEIFAHLEYPAEGGCQGVLLPSQRR